MTAPSLPPDGRRLRARWDARWDPLALAVVLFAAYVTVSVSRYRQLATLSWDLGIFEQAVRAYAHFQAPIVDLKGPGFNILGDHFSPVTALLAPAYRLFPTPVTLLVAQSALFALSAVPVTRAAARLLGRRKGLALGVAYGLSWGVQRAVDFDFHEICFAVPLIAFSLEALLAQRWRAALLWALPLVLVKEDLGLTAAAIAVVVLVRARRRSPDMVPYAVAVIGFCTIATLVTFTVIIPAFNATGGYDYWDKVGDAGPFDGMGTKLSTLAWLLLPTSGLLAVRSPLCAVALPTLAWRFLSSDDHYWGTDWHYSAVLMPVVSLALADALATTRHSRRRWLHTYARNLPTAVASAALALTTALPLAALAEPDTYGPPPARVTAVKTLLASIPDGSTVEANVGPIAQLTSRCRVFWVGGTKGLAPDFIALDNSAAWISDVHAYARQLHPDVRYDLYGAAHGYVLLKRHS